jgi:outer membrane protein assembly factor BamB
VAPDTGYGNSIGHFWCIDITKKGDVSCPAYDFDPKSPKNKESALVWHFGGEGKGDRKAVFGKTLSSPVVHDGLVYMPEETGFFHCFDAATGKELWEHDIKTDIWGSPLYAGGKIYLAAEDGNLYIFAPGREKKLLAEIDMGEGLKSTPVAANGVLYVTTVSKVYAIAVK